MNVLKLVEYRKKANMTQFEVSKVLNVSQSYYSRLEKGKNFPDAQQIIQLCKIFKCTPNDLFGVHGVYEVAFSGLIDKNEN
ncbi:hypothetical protein, phage-related [Alteracholeplasma palmae J233]|uniref:HTH cro/C1-type domain-containing protein n=1 Tax=Alteracholeplasma palmae (strain ATCC 49389 / J233) TaxID=1318466 RepID=U4KR10_ALTPJ|nr:helix-turn-helix transcriptional regulator [Alteracholeplasma palmae]CCV63766.1 hypothetical protein, phage-related [Alteracholeplasma palmae J233]